MFIYKPTQKKRKIIIMTRNLFKLIPVRSLESQSFIIPKHAGL